MKLLYDHQIFQMQNYGGISRYFKELLANIQDEDLEYKLSILWSNNEYLKQINKGYRLPNNIYKKLYRYMNYIHKVISNNIIEKNNFDLFHPTYFDDYYLDKLKKPFVITVYDLINEKYPEYFENNQKVIQVRKVLLNRAKKIIAISENTKKDILEYYGIEDSKIEVIYLSESLSNIDSIKVNDIPESYILFVGNRDGYKNFKRFLTAISNILTQENVNLLCAGGGAFSEHEMQLISQYKIHDKVYNYQFKHDGELKYLYASAKLFVFPSLYEGFGIPLLESLSSGCLTCVSDSSSLAEIGGDSVYYFDPMSEQDIYNSVLNGLSCDDKAAVKQQGYMHANKFTWKKTAIDTYNLYKGCV